MPRSRVSYHPVVEFLRAQISTPKLRYQVMNVLAPHLREGFSFSDDRFRWQRFNPFAMWLPPVLFIKSFLLHPYTFDLMVLGLTPPLGHSTALVVFCFHPKGIRET